MLHHALEWIEPILVNALLATVTAVLGVITRYLPRVVRQWVDARRRDALHSAIATGVDYALATVEAGARTIPAVAVIDRASGYVWQSVPGTIRHFFGKQAAAAQKQINDMILARIREVAPDELAQALRDAGLPAVDARG